MHDLLWVEHSHDIDFVSFLNISYNMLLNFRLICYCFFVSEGISQYNKEYRIIHTKTKYEYDPGETLTIHHNNPDDFSNIRKTERMYGEW